MVWKKTDSKGMFYLEESGKEMTEGMSTDTPIKEENSTVYMGTGCTN